MLILACNVGSTSLKYRLYNLGEVEKELASGQFSGVARASGASRQQAGDILEESSLPALDYAAAIESMLAFLGKTGALPPGSLPGCVAFKTVAALGYTGVQLLNEDVLDAMAQLNGLLPAHNPPYISAIRQFARRMPGVPLVGSFETGFFSDMAPEAYLYPLPLRLVDQGIRRRGAHGASHEYVAQWVAQRERRDDLKLISCHLGGSSSLAAVKNCRGVDTTIGLSMQTGLPHNNRTGDIDPCLTHYLHLSLGMSLDDIQRMYAQESGLLGLSGGLSGDMQALEAMAKDGNVQAATAVDAFCYQVKKQIGAFAAALEGVDVIAFAGGIGQHSAGVREKALAGLGFMGVALDSEKNAASLPDSLISRQGAPVRVYIVATNEEIIIARQAKAFLDTK